MRFGAFGRVSKETLFFYAFDGPGDAKNKNEADAGKAQWRGDRLNIMYSVKVACGINQSRKQRED